MTKYIATTSAQLLRDLAGESPIAMVDGTVPGWTKGYHDLHWDHHRPGGGRVQIDELPQPAGLSILGKETNILLQEANWNSDTTEWAIATTQIDADACVAAAYLQLAPSALTPDIVRKLRAIALDCDYLCIPPGEPEQDLAEFAAKAVAALKESSKGLPKELGLPEDRKTWNEAQKVQYASEAFKRGTEWLIDAVYAKRWWPGESGEADAYFEQMQRDTEALRQLRCVRLIQGCAVLDMRSINKYVDPRCLVAIAQEMEASNVLTLTARSMDVGLGIDMGEGEIKIPGCQYTLGSLPYHPNASTLDLTAIFPLLAKAEANRRTLINLSPAETTWGGRATVGGSGWRDASLLSPEEVLAIALAELAIPF